ncbi:sensor histidine kinase [Foetidibacter luteolus]|uniref:sensor histidine kinase n=1 Tax=Foetidibacter luteolus TaxID=2608880 RepID=UPI001A97F0B3|nr:sensor histidine kinase [Foetidibacter luteolus]
MEITLSLVEEERARIAGDIHDEIGSLLGLMKRRLEKGAPADKSFEAWIKEQIRLIDEIVASGRTLAYELYPPALERGGLGPALGDLIGMVGDSVPADLQLNYQIDEVILSNETKINIYRIVQELINNAVKHAEATEITVDLSMKADRISLSVKDNGTGLDNKTFTFSHPGRGLPGIRARVKSLKGTMHYSSGKKPGTHFQILIPLS